MDCHHKTSTFRFIINIANKTYAKAYYQRNNGRYSYLFIKNFFVGVLILKILGDGCKHANNNGNEYLYLIVRKLRVFGHGDVGAEYFIIYRNRCFCGDDEG